MQSLRTSQVRIMQPVAVTSLQIYLEVVYDYY
jgi:hypothetical protein